MHQEVGADSGRTEGRPGGMDEAPVVREGRRGADVAAALLTFGLGLGILYFMFVLIGTIDVGDSAVFTVIAVVLILLWAAGAIQRRRAGGEALITRADRERRGF